jgi:hypothetical protein
MAECIDIYIAVPYSHDDFSVCEYRYQVATKYAADQVALGHTVYSPITHSHPLVVLRPDLRRDWEFWKRQDQAIIPICLSLHVLMLPGWVGSIGVAKEIRAFEKDNKPIVRIGLENLG